MTVIDYGHRKLWIEQRLQFLAGCCRTPESSEHTSARLRIDLLRTTSEEVAADVATRGNCSGDWLAPLESDDEGTPGPQPSVLPTRASDKGFLPMGVEDYLIVITSSDR